MELRYRRRSIDIDGRRIRLRTLLNSQQFDDPDNLAEALGVSSATWPLFGVVWPSGEVLARTMASEEVSGRRILEVGCGIALPSLLLQLRGADMSATDHHPLAGAFLRHNLSLNDAGDIAFSRSEWRDLGTSLGLFDLIIGSDLLYEPEHAEILSSFISRHAAPGCEAVIVDPGRGNAARFAKRMAQHHFTVEESRPRFSELAEPFTGRLQRYHRS